jgi:hypothetical protein
VKVLLAKEGSHLARRWAGDATGMKDGSRSAPVLAIAGELVRLRVPTPEVEGAVRYWCREQGYDKGDRPEWVRATVAKAYEFDAERADEARPVAEAPDDPHRLARLYLAGHRADGGRLLLRHWQDEFYRWVRGAYTRHTEGEVKAAVVAAVKEEYDRQAAAEAAQAGDRQGRPSRPAR